MARGSASNVTENRTRSKKSAPTKEIEDKQTTDSTDKKNVTTRRKNNIPASKVNKKLETDNSGETSSASNMNEELNELVGKKEVSKKNQVTKPVGRKRKVEHTVEELTEEAEGEVEVEIVEKRSIRGQDKKLKTGNVDESSQDSMKVTKSGSTKKTKHTKVVEENIIDEYIAEEKDMEINVKDSEVEVKIDNMEKKELSATLDDSSQGSVKIGTMRKTRSARKVEENVTVEPKETKDVKADESKNYAKADTLDDTSQDSMKIIKSGPTKKTRSAKRNNKVLILEQDDTNAAEADKNMNLEGISLKGDTVDENSRDSVKLSNSFPTRKTRSAKKVEEIVMLSDEDKDSEQKDIAIIHIDDLVAKEKTDMVEEDDKDLTTLIKSGASRKTRSRKKVEEIIIVGHTDAKPVEVNENICIENDLNDDASQDSVKVTQVGLKRKTRSAKKADVDGQEDSSLDSIKSDQSGPTRKSRNVKKVVKIATEKHLEKKDKNEEVEPSTTEKCMIELANLFANRENKGITEKDRSTKHITKNISDKPTDKVTEQISSKKVEGMEQDDKEIESDNVNESTRDSLELIKDSDLKTKNMKDTEENILVEHKNKVTFSEHECLKNEEKLDSYEDIAKDFEHTEYKSSELETEVDQHEKNRDSDDEKSEMSFEKNENECNEDKHQLEAIYDIPPSNITGLGLKNISNKDSEENFAFDSQKSDALQSCVDGSVTVNVSSEKENSGKVIELRSFSKRDYEVVESAIVEESNKNKPEVRDTTENLDKNVEVSEKGNEKKMEDKDEFSKIKKYIFLTDKTTLLKNVEEKVPVDKEKVLNDDKFDDDNQSKFQTVLVTDQLSNKEKDKVDASGKNENNSTSEDQSIEEPKNIVADLDCMPGKVDFSDSQNNENFIEGVLSTKIDCGEGTNKEEIITGKESDLTSPESVIVDESIKVESNFDIEGFDSIKECEELETPADKSMHQEQSNLYVENECVSDKTLSVIEICAEQCENKAEIVKAVEVTTGNETDSRFSEKLIELKDGKVYESEIEEISIKNPRLVISVNIDQGDSTASIVGETCEKIKVDIDACSDKTEEASVANFESETSTTDSDTGNLFIADNVESISTETEISEQLVGIKPVVSISSDFVDKNKKDTSINKGKKIDINIAGCEFKAEEISNANVSESPIKNITGDDAGSPMRLEVNTMEDASLTLTKVEMAASTQHTIEDGTDEDANNISASGYEHSSVMSGEKSSNYLSVTDDLKEKSSQNRSENSTENENVMIKSNIINSSVNICEDKTGVEQKNISSVINDKSVDGEPKLELNIVSTANEMSKDNIKMPLTISNKSSTSKDNSESGNHCQMTEGSSSSPDKIVNKSRHGESNFDASEKQKSSKKKKLNKSIEKEGESNKTSNKLKDVERNEAGKRIITTYEVSSNVGNQKGVKRNSGLANEGECVSGTEVSLALKIKRKRVEEVDSCDAASSSLGEQGVSNETNVKNQTQQPSADYQSVPGPSGIQQESKRSTRKRKIEELDQQSRENSAAPIRMYLEKFVPFLLEGLLKITYVRPEDPIQYLADWMKENKEAAYSSMNSGDISSDE